MAQKFNPPFGSGGKTVSKPMAKSPEQQMGQAVEPMEEDGSQVAAQHGPASMVNIEHEMGSHHVSSIHQDGHEHHSDHPTTEAAHEHAKKLSGAGAEHSEPDGDEGEEPWGKE